MDHTTAPLTLNPVATSPARARLQERVRLLVPASSGPREHVGGRPAPLRWSGLAAH